MKTQAQRDTVIANQEHIVKAIRSLFATRKPAQRSPLTPTQRFIVTDLRSLILQKDSPSGKPGAFTHWEIRKLKNTRTVLLASVVGRVERYILIGPRGLLQPLDSKDATAQLELDQAIEEMEQADAQGTA